MGTAPTRTIGASRSQNASRATVAAISAPMPNGMTASCAIKSRLVLWTDSRIGAMSRGATVLRSITSTERPCTGHDVGRGQGLVHHSGDRHEGHVGAGPYHGRLADGKDVVSHRLRALHAVEEPVLDEDHGIRVLDGRPQEAIGIGRRRRHHDAQPRNVSQQRLQALGVLAARRSPCAELGPDRQRHLRGATGHERHLCRLVEQLVEADADEIEIHQLDDRAHARHGRAHSEADDGRLRDRSVPDAVTELVVEAPHEPEDVATLGHVDAGDEHPVVAGQLHLEGGVDGVHRAETWRILGRRWRLGGRRAGAGDEVGERGRRGLRQLRAASSASSSSLRHHCFQGLDLARLLIPIDSSCLAWMMIGSRSFQACTSASSRYR